MICIFLSKKEMIEVPLRWGFHQNINWFIFQYVRIRCFKHKQNSKMYMISKSSFPDRIIAVLGRWVKKKSKYSIFLRFLSIKLWYDDHKCDFVTKKRRYLLFHSVVSMVIELNWRRTIAILFGNRTHPHCNSRWRFLFVFVFLLCIVLIDCIDHLLKIV